MRKLCLLTAIALLLLLAAPISAQPSKPAPPDLPTFVKATLHAFQKLAAQVTLPTCADLNHANLQTSDTNDAIKDGAVYCREIAGNGSYILNPGALGDQSVIDQGVVQAYNVFGLTAAGTAVQRFGHPITVCLQGRGQLLLLPAFAAPHFVETPPVYSSGGYTCASFSSPGVVALVNEGE